MNRRLYLLTRDLRAAIDVPEAAGPGVVEWLRGEIARYNQREEGGMSEPTIAVGDRLVWEPHKPHAYEHIEITAIRTNADGETWVEAKNARGELAWNELDRFIEACFPGVPAAPSPPR